ncbi:hypothetical protein [Nocardioides yefusunii]|uniref:Uncharacterized protein n=1 Tax=Nocardioides yefusunii TaxID=2500546 RepID=A0ABW1QT17_9ACTN|nr:hypothetical protein [Nocardioides yefusunii]
MTNPTLHDQLDDLVLDVHLDHTRIAAGARADGAFLRRRRHRTRGVVALGTAAAVGLLSLGTSGWLPGSSPIAAPADGPATTAEPLPWWMPQEWPSTFPDFSFDRYVHEGQVPAPESERYLHPAEKVASGADAIGMVLSPGVSGVEVPDDAPETIRLDGRIATAMLLERLEALGRDDLTVDPISFGGEHGDTAVQDGGVITGSGTATLADGSADVDGVQGHARIEVLVMVAEEEPSNNRCGVAGREVACTLITTENGGTMLVQRKESPDDYSAQEINVYDPVEGLRIRVSTLYPAGQGDVFSDHELKQLVTDPAWRLQVPSEYYSAGQALPYFWLPGIASA